MRPKIKRDAAYFAAMSNRQVEEALLMLCIGQRFDGDVAFLTRLWDGEHSFEKSAELREIIIKANPHRHSSIYPPEEGESGYLVQP